MTSDTTKVEHSLSRRVYDDIDYSTDRGIATITIDRPSVSNAFTRETIAELAKALDTMSAADETHAVILTGAGDAFCAGADVNDLPNWHEQPKSEYVAYLQEIQAVVHQLRTMEEPIIAAVSGPAAGAGCDLALACDVRVFGQAAFLRPGFVRIGLIPGDGGAWLLTKLLGEAKAKEILFDSSDISADRAYELGLAANVAEDPLTAASEYARDLLSRPIKAVKRTKRLVHSDGSFADHCDLAVEYQWECLNDEEHVEALSAAREGRDPSFDREYE